MENRALTKSSWPTILSEMFRLECLHRTWDRGRKLAHRFKTVQWESGEGNGLSMAKHIIDMYEMSQ